nr:Chain C, MAGE-A4 peptide (amino acids 230-239) variant [Homo sapiens]
AVYDGREHTV